MEQKLNSAKNQENSKEKTELMSPKMDVVFQALFGEVGNERITKKFLEAVLERKIEKVDLSENIVLRRETEEDKLGVLDVLAKIDNGEYCNIEMQMATQETILKRILYYWSRVYTKNIKKSQDYNALKKTIQVLITNFEIKELKGLEYRTKWKIIEEKERKRILTDEFEICIIEIPKIYKLSPKKQTQEVIKWIYFFENPENKEAWGYMKKEEEPEEIKEAREKLRVISEDEKMQRIVELRQKAIMDEKAGKEYARNQGIEEGKTQGIEVGKMQVAKRMKEKGFDINTIKDLTGLTKKEIENI